MKYLNRSKVMKSNTRFVILFSIFLLVLLMLAACAQNPANYQGITRVLIDYDETGIAQIQAIDGKEFGVETVEIVNPDGSIIKVFAKDVKAFQGQEFRDKLRTTLITEGIPNPSKDLLDAIVSIVTAD